MCSRDDDPSMYNAPYDPEPPASIALAVLGDLINEEETAPTYYDALDALRTARDRIATAEAKEVSR